MIKGFLKRAVLHVLNLEASLVLRKYKPKIIGITGSVGKTSTKEAVYAVLGFERSVRRSEKSYNSELGVPLTILGRKTAWLSPIGWLMNILAGLKLIFIRDKSYPEILVLEMGVDRPGDIAKITDIARPDISVVTAIGEVPVHVEFFASPEAIAREKSKILRNLGVNDLAVLNFDDLTVYDMKDKTRANIITYGFGEHADVRASNYQIIYREEDKKTIPVGISFKVDYKGSTVPVRLPKTFGKHQVYAALSAIAIGVHEGMNIIEAAEALSKYSSSPGRLKLIEGIKHSWILDDTYNSSPHALHAAIDTIRDIPAKRKIAVLGDMLELGQFTIEAHREAGKRMKNIVDVLIVVGPRAKFIADEARAGKFPQKNIFEFYDSWEAGRKLQEIIEEEDLILIKGSQSMRMERIVEEVMAYPQDAKDLLVRQDNAWKRKK